ncbi:25679_t:CDS:2, partial [Dentiscutata erythropus]
EDIITTSKKNKKLKLSELSSLLSTPPRRLTPIYREEIVRFSSRGRGFHISMDVSEEEYYDTSHPEEFETTERWYNEQRNIQDDTNLGSLTSSPIDLYLPIISTFSRDKQSDDDDIIQQYY